MTRQRTPIDPVRIVGQGCKHYMESTLIKMLYIDPQLVRIVDPH